MSEGSELQVGTTKQLFLDDLIIHEQCDVDRTLHQPAKYTGNPLMFPLYPWEGRITLYGNVMRDPDDPDLFRMWYTGYGGMGIRQMGSKDTSKWAHLGFDPNNLLYMYCHYLRQSRRLECP